MRLPSSTNITRQTYPPNGRSRLEFSCYFHQTRGVEVDLLLHKVCQHAPEKNNDQCVGRQVLEQQPQQQNKEDRSKRSMQSPFVCQSRVLQATRKKIMQHETHPNGLSKPGLSSDSYRSRAPPHRGRSKYRENTPSTRELRKTVHKPNIAETWNTNVHSGTVTTPILSEHDCNKWSVRQPAGKRAYGNSLP